LRAAEPVCRKKHVQPKAVIHPEPSVEKSAATALLYNSTIWENVIKYNFYVDLAADITLENEPEEF